MAKKQTDDVISLLEMAASDVQALTEEMEEWQGNMEGANMEHLPKYEQVTECVSGLQDADLATYVETLVDALGAAEQHGFACNESIEHVVSTAKRQSRADRLGEACGYLEVALDSIEGRLVKHFANLSREPEPADDAEGAERQQKLDSLYDVESATQDVRNAWDGLLGVEFPGAFGG